MPTALVSAALGKPAFPAFAEFASGMFQIKFLGGGGEPTQQKMHDPQGI